MLPSCFSLFFWGELHFFVGLKEVYSLIKPLHGGSG